MGLLSRFFGRKEVDDHQAKPLVASPTDEALSLQLLFAHELPTDPRQITEALQRYHPSMATARGETARISRRKALHLAWSAGASM